MVNVADWSSTPNSNSSVDGINIAENCPAANMNGAIRAVMAGVKSFYSSLPTFAQFLKADGSVPTTSGLTFSGRGAYKHWASASQGSGRVFHQAVGSPDPSGLQDGDEILDYS